MSHPPVGLLVLLFRLRFGDVAVRAVDGVVAGAGVPKIAFADGTPLRLGALIIDRCQSRTVFERTLPDRCHAGGNSNCGQPSTIIE